jgi:adenine-specific DNA-methyltransferase
VSRLNDLLRELRTREPALARDLEREAAALADRRAFGLNFERHVPEAVELPGRKVRKGDKVRILTPRGQMPNKSDERLWRIVGIDRSTRTATLERLVAPGPDLGEPVVDAREARTAALDNLVVVAEFRDPIYPGLVSTGRVQRGGDKPFHTVINAENFHALEVLLFTHRGRVDCIYIDPPYNTGAKDWKYNNDYVEGDDLYRHSKWLAFMERRLLLAKELLNPGNSVLIVTIDEKEYLRLGLLLEQTFPEADIQMIASVINPKGSARIGRFSRVEEYIYFLMFGASTVRPWSSDMLRAVTSETRSVRWAGLMRNGEGSRRSRIPSMFFPIYLDAKRGSFHSAGEPPPRDVSPGAVASPPGTVAMWPIDGSGQELMWRLNPDSVRTYHALGQLKFGRRDQATGIRSISYLQSGVLEQIASGEIAVRGRDDEGALVLEYADSLGTRSPATVWNMTSHSSSDHGANMLKALVPGRRFPYPKALYAVEDTIRFFVGKKREAVIVDFFAGSGTTAHAVMRLNKQDGGSRQCISITNNEVAADEQKSLGEKGLRPGDVEWEQHGICEYITNARIAAAITGKTPDGTPVKGDYKFTDEFPMADGFRENVEFLRLTYEVPLRVASNREFAKIAPLLWIRAGSRGRRIDDISAGWDVADAYGVLADLDHTQDFLKAVAANDAIAMAYIVTDEGRLFESVAQELPDHVEPVRLYESYLRNFEIESGRGSV